MITGAQKIRPFLGAKDFDISRSFYRDLGFRELPISKQMSVFDADDVSFYLQRAYVKDWIDNTMIFLEVADLDSTRAKIEESGVVKKYPGVRLSEIVNNDWGREFFLHDPSGILWHIGTFTQ